MSASSAIAFATTHDWLTRLLTTVPLLCIVDDEGRLLGIVDRADLLGAAGDAHRELAAARRSGNDAVD